MAIQVVDLLEVVDVEQQQAEGFPGLELSSEFFVEHAVTEQPRQGIVTGLVTTLLVQKCLVDRQLAQADQVQQHLVGLGPDRRGSGDREDPDRLASGFEDELLPVFVQCGSHVATVGKPGRVAGAGEHHQRAAAVDQHHAGAHVGLGDERVGHLPSDGFELEHARKHGCQLMKAVQLVQLSAHPRVQHPVLNGERDAVRDRPQLGGLGALEWLVATTGKQQQPQ